MCPQVPNSTLRVHLEEPRGGGGTLDILQDWIDAETCGMALANAIRFMLATHPALLSRTRSHKTPEEVREAYEGVDSE